MKKKNILKEEIAIYKADKMGLPLEVRVDEETI